MPTSGLVSGRRAPPLRRPAAAATDEPPPALERARQRFPVEPLRTRDALHLGAALEFERELGRLTLVSLDGRIRENAAALRLAIAP